jgi:ABC-type branched-subunit amino acid transport system ATPase component
MLLDPGILFATLLGGLSRAMILFLLASGLSLTFGVMNILNFAHATLWLLGGYITFSIFTFIADGMSLGDTALVLVAAIILGTAVMAVVAYLSGGEQQMLTVGRTLMGNPSLVLLDEPVEGVAPIVVEELGIQIRKLKDMGLTILFSEQNLRFARQISDRAYVIEKGRIKFSGTMDELRENQEIQKKYLMI